MFVNSTSVKVGEIFKVSEFKLKVSQVRQMAAEI